DSSGNSRKPDHEAINAMLNDELQPLLAEMADKFDPSINVPNTPDGVGLTPMCQRVAGWRETAWTEAEALANASDPVAFAAVSQSIQASAAAEAESLVLSDPYTPTDATPTPAARYLYCMLHHNDPAPTAYPWGTPT